MKNAPFRVCGIPICDFHADAWIEKFRQRGLDVKGDKK